LTNNKNQLRRGKVQLVNGVDFYQKMRKSLGNKRNEISDEQIDELVIIYGDMKPGENCKLFDNEDFCYQKITVERPLRLNFKIDEERVQELYNQTAFKNLTNTKKRGAAGLKEIEEGEKLQKQIIETLLS